MWGMSVLVQWGSAVTGKWTHLFVVGCLIFKQQTKCILRICVNNCMCCYTETKLAGQT